MPRTLVINHVPFEDLGSWAPLLRGRGHEVETLFAGIDPVDRERALDADLLIILGGPISANDEASFPFLTGLRETVAKRLAANGSTLGVCLGAQIMARSLGAAVRPMKGKEIGWSPLTLTNAGRTSPLRHLEVHQAAVLHWHGEAFDLPDATASLASTPRCAHQAFTLGNHALALQFHAEVTPSGLEGWYIGHVGELAATSGLSVAELRADSEYYGPALERAGAALLDEWLANAPGRL